MELVKRWIVGLVGLTLLGILLQPIHADVVRSTTVVGGGGSSFDLGAHSWSGAQTIAADAGLDLGGTTNAFASLIWNTTQTADTAMLLTGSTSNAYVLAERADTGFDFAHAATTTPTLFIHSNNQSTTQWLGLTHNATNGVISVGTGKLVTPAIDFNLNSASLANIGNAFGSTLITFINSGGITYQATSVPHKFNNTLTSGSVVQIAMQSTPTINQTATGGYTAFQVAATETGTGSGTKLLQQWLAGVAGTTEKASLDNLGTLTLTGKYRATSTAPAVSACGATPGTVTGSDVAGRLTTGSGGTVQSCTITFSVAYSATPSCVVNDETGILLVRATSSTTTLVMDSAVAGTLASQVLNYICIQGS